MSNCALIGLPNTGKTSFFNAMTNSHYKTGNWSGVTVTEHRAALSNTNHILIDLPGIVGLFDSDVLDAQVSLQALEQADVLIQVIDARHLHRDLILTIQLLAYEKPLIAVLTHLSGSIEKMQKVLPVDYVCLMLRKLALPHWLMQLQTVEQLILGHC